MRYIMAVQNHLLSNTVLIHPDDSDDSDNSLQGETMKVQVNISFKWPLLFVNLCMPVELHVDYCVHDRHPVPSRIIDTFHKTLSSNCIKKITHTFVKQ